MKIVHLAQRYWPHGGGVEYHLAQVNKQFIADGHVVSVITEQHEADLPLSEVKDGVTILRIPQVKVMFKNQNFLTNFIQKTWQKIHRWWFMFRLIPYFRQATIVQVHDIFWWILPMWWLIPSPVCMTFHGYEQEQGPTLKQQRWHQIAAALTDGSLGIGGFHAKWYGVEPTLVSYGAVATQDIESNPQQSIDNRLHVIFIGRLAPLTGAQQLIDAVAQLSESDRSRIRVSIYGGGDSLGEMRERVAHDHLPITLFGFQPDARNYLQTADIVCVSQYLAILEALVVDKSIVSFAGSDFKEAVLTTTPYKDALTITRNVIELKNYLEAAIQKNNVQKPSKEIVDWANKQSWKSMTDMYYSLWKSTQEHHE